MGQYDRNEQFGSGAFAGESSTRENEYRERPGRIRGSLNDTLESMSSLSQGGQVNQSNASQMQYQTSAATSYGSQYTSTSPAGNPQGSFVSPGGSTNGFGAQQTVGSTSGFGAQQTAGQQRDMPGSSLPGTSPGMQGSRLRVDRTRRQIRRPTTTVHMQVSSFQMVRMLSLIVRVEQRRLRWQAADRQIRQQISLLPADRGVLCQTRLLPGIGTEARLQAIPAYVTGGFLPISQCGRRIFRYG